MPNPNFSSWMSNACFQNLTLSQLVMPGTHDTGTFSISSTSPLSLINYSDINFLWQLQPTSAIASGMLPWANPMGQDPNMLNPFVNAKGAGLNYLYVGQAMYGVVMNVAYGMAVSQDQTTLEQLNGGIRYMDLRVYFDNTTSPPDFYVQHAFRGCTLSSMLQDVATFLAQSNSAGATELVILNISHVNYSTDTPLPAGSPYQGPTIAQALTQLLTSVLPASSTCQPPPYAAGDPDPFLAMSGTTLADILGGTTKVLILNGDMPLPPASPSSSSIVYDAPVFNSYGYYPAPNNADGTNDLTTLQQGALSGLQSPLFPTTTPAQLGRLAWCLTCNTAEAITQATNQLSGVPPQPPILQLLAQSANDNLWSFVTQSPAPPNINCITVDWYDFAPQGTWANPLYDANQGPGPDNLQTIQCNQSVVWVAMMMMCGQA